MKALKLLTLAAILLVSTVYGSTEKEVNIDETIITETQVKNIDFDELKEKASASAEPLKESLAGSQEALSLETANCIACLYPTARSIVVPYSEGMTYVNGVLCHVANYSHASLITVLEGFNYGLQTTVDYYGYVISVNATPVIEYSAAGATFKHFYPDCTVVTGLNQVIMFY